MGRVLRAGCVNPYIGDMDLDPGHPDNCRGLGLEHRWAPSEFSKGIFCSKCGAHKNGTSSLAEELFTELGMPIPDDGEPNPYPED